MINIFEVTETNKMIEQENLDVRTITMGISLLDCIDSDLGKLKNIDIMSFQIGAHLIHLLIGKGKRKTRTIVLLHAREAEIHELGRAVLGVEHVLRLHVAVHETALGGERQGVRHLLAHAHHVRHVQRAGVRLHLLVEGSARHELHRDVGHALLLSEGVDLRDVRMVEPRRGLRLALETLHERRV